jgi:trigger factor
MKINLNELEYCKYNVEYESGIEEVLNKRNQVLDVFKKAPVKGFRQGKAPLEVISRVYKDQIDESVKKGLLEEAYHNTVFEKKLKVHGAPFFNSASLIGNLFTCAFVVQTKPEFELAHFQSMELPKPHETFSVQQITENLLQELRVKFGETVPYSDEDFVQAKDNVIIDYECFLDGEKIENLSAQGEMLTVGAGQLVEFEDNLLGMKQGEEKEFSLKVPETGLPSVAGKTVQMKVSLLTGSKNVPCPLDDTLAQKIDKQNFAELREFVTGIATAQVSNNYKTALNNAICAKLIADNKFQTPHFFVLSEAQYLYASTKGTVPWDQLNNEDKEKYIEVATHNVKLSLILDKIREEYPEANLSDQEVLEMLKTNIVNNKISDDPDKVMKELIQNNMLPLLFSRIKDTNTLDYIAKSVRVIE